jgi:hypothetical protein
VLRQCSSSPLKILDEKVVIIDTFDGAFVAIINTTTAKR